MILKKHLKKFSTAITLSSMLSLLFAHSFESLIHVALEKVDIVCTDCLLQTRV